MPLIRGLIRSRVVDNPTFWNAPWPEFMCSRWIGTPRTLPNWRIASMTEGRPEWRPQTLPVGVAVDHPDRNRRDLAAFGMQGGFPRGVQDCYRLLESQ
jgi:hypothetical protein